MDRSKTERPSPVCDATSPLAPPQFGSAKGFETLARRGFKCSRWRSCKKEKEMKQNPKLDGPDHLTDDPTNDVARENRVYDMEFSWPSDRCLGTLIIIKGQAIIGSTIYNLSDESAVGMKLQAESVGWLTSGLLCTLAWNTIANHISGIETLFQC
ncbi:hypothetical protein MUK42_35051 [Musa troglodytarum]|uniref:Uncharacterized protein n=1 Tax=Musa troglodytarum TaxID=320322 RepID=A0A9E7FTA6_9LILI|nr:hypothetical protein MUK42_35051 [Musa troglodytarum]